MELYIVRHGIAEDVASDGTDASRALTEEGRKKMKEAAAGFVRLGRPPARIFSSPLVRARQTAEILAHALKSSVEEMTELAPGHSPAQVCDRLQQLKTVDRVMVVGHEPNCSELAAYLLSARGNVRIEFKKGAVCAIETRSAEAGSGTLITHLSPAAMRSMAG